MGAEDSGADFDSTCLSEDIASVSYTHLKGLDLCRRAAEKYAEERDVTFAVFVIGAPVVGQRCV